jgi:hypothetical protein
MIGGSIRPCAIYRSNGDEIAHVNIYVNTTRSTLQEATPWMTGTRWRRSAIAGGLA